MDKAAEQVFREREQRLIDAVELKIPDRVPISIGLNYFPAKFTGTTTWAAYYDFPNWKKAYIKAAKCYEPDRLLVVLNQSGTVLEALDAKQIRWPGHGVSRFHTHQFVEGEYMKEDEYDLLLNDTSDFLVRRYLPRVYGILGPIGKLPPLNTLINMLPFNHIADPDFVTMLGNMLQVAKEAVQWQTESFALVRELTEMGYFCRNAPFMVSAPFDIVSDFLRGMRGTMLDMYRRKDQLLQACEMMCRIQLDRIAQLPAATEFTPSFIPLHRGAHGFMSLGQFEIFYWPYLLKVIHALVDKGFTPDLFFEGDYNSRLEYLAQMPKGKVIARFDQIDMTQAKRVLGNKVCIAGNVPVSLLQFGTVDEVKKKCRELIDTAGKDGGYMLAPASALDEVNPDNLKAMIEFTKEYGRYR
ncbi:MAG TPA: uroporphyrinogen decarboxylase family protein [Acidobacteriota bacterium]|nr:uroporphyrinogen decarboxylase family protein [Acidobacteriota bacterium]